MKSMTQISQTNKVAGDVQVENCHEAVCEIPKRFVAMRYLSSAESAMSKAAIEANRRINRFRDLEQVARFKDERGDVPGWVLVVLMTTGLVTAIWTIAAPRLTAILKDSLDAMNGIR